MVTKRIKDMFGVSPIEYGKIDSIVNRCANAYKALPDWLDDSDHIRTINFTKAVCEETARLTMLATKISTGDSAMGQHLQETIDKMYGNLRPWVEYANAYGTIVLKPSADDVEVFYPGDFIVMGVTAGKIDAMVFVYREKVELTEEKDVVFERYEYHRYEATTDAVTGEERKVYVITNKCYSSDAKKEVDIKATPWSDLDEEVRSYDIESPLFAVLTTPHANGFDTNCPLSTPICANAIEEMRDLDIAYSRLAYETEQSKRTVLMDSDRLLAGADGPMTEGNKAWQMDRARQNMGLPDMVRVVEGSGNDIYNEINPSMNTEQRISGINYLLSQIGYKVGFANGYFVFNQASGIQTATGVEANQQRTIQFIKDCRDKLEEALRNLVYAISVMAETYQGIPQDEYDLTFDFGDITYNREEDRARWWSYVAQGYVPAWMFFQKFEGMTEEDARAMIDEATNARKDLMDAFEM